MGGVGEGPTIVAEVEEITEDEVVIEEEGTTTHMKLPREIKLNTVVILSMSACWDGEGAR